MSSSGSNSALITLITDKGFELVVIELHAIDVLHECLNLMPLEQEARHIEQTAAGVKEQLAREDAGIFA